MLFLEVIIALFPFIISLHHILKPFQTVYHIFNLIDFSPGPSLQGPLFFSPFAQLLMGNVPSQSCVAGLLPFSKVVFIEV